MLNHLTGKIFSLNDHVLVVDVHGIGINVFITRTVREEIVTNDREDIFLYSRLIGRDGDYVVYGFYDEQERLVFDHLRQVQGVGARTSILILSHLSSPDVLRAVREEKGEVFSAVKGIGKKVADRIVLELKNKIDTIWAYEEHTTGSHGEVLTESITEPAVRALVHLGCKRTQAKNTVEKVLKKVDSPLSLEEIIKESLKVYNE